MSNGRGHRRRRHRDGLHRHRPRRGPAPHRRPGPRRAGQHAGARRGPAPRRSASAAPTPSSTTSSPTTEWTSSTSRPRTICTSRRRARSSCRQARRVREAAGHDRPRVGRSSSPSPRPPGLVNATNFNIRFYPLNQHARDTVTAGSLGEVRLVTGRYFQDWLLLDSDWNWRLEPDRGGALRAVGDIGSHWIDLMTFVTGQRIVGHGRARDVHRRRAGADRPGRDVPPATATDAVQREIATEDAAMILLRFEGGARGSVSISQISAGRKNCLQYEIDGSEASVVGLRDARPDLVRASRPAQRDPA